MQFTKEFVGLVVLELDRLTERSAKCPPLTGRVRAMLISRESRVIREKSRGGALPVWSGSEAMPV